MAARHFGEFIKAKKKQFNLIVEFVEVGSDRKGELFWKKQVEKMFAQYFPNTPLSPIRSGIFS